MKPEEMTAVQERRFRKSVDYFRKNREIYVRRIKKILEEYKNSVVSERCESDDVDLLVRFFFHFLFIFCGKFRSLSR